MPAGFTQLAGLPLWRLDAAPAACLALLVPADPGATPAAVTLAQAWGADPGNAFLFLPGGTSPDAALAAAAEAFLAARGAGARFAWVENPADPVWQWRGPSISFAGGVTSGASLLALRTDGLWVGAGCTAATTAAGDAIALTPPAGSTAVTLGLQSGASSVAGSDAPLAIRFDALAAGCATTALTLRGGGDLTALDAGLRVFVTDDDLPQLPDRLASLRFPVFGAGQPPLPVTLSADPLRPLDPGRTFLGLVPDGAPVGPALPSCFVTANGLRTTLTPLARTGAPAAKLVGAVRALSAPSAAVDPLSFVPSGPFALTVLAPDGRPASGPQQLLCGLSGIETIELEPGAELWFTPGGAARAGDRGLDAAATTSYASLFAAGGAAGPVYRAQPDGAPLFGLTGRTGFLGYSPLAGTVLPAAPADGTLPPGYPLMPFTGIDPAAPKAPFERVEQLAVAPTRRRLIGGIGNPATLPLTPGGDPPIAGLTPQGLLAGIVGGAVTQLTLIRSHRGADLHLLQLDAVSDALATALQSSQLMLVCSEPATLQQKGAPKVDGSVSIPADDDASEWWTFDAWPSAPWGDSSTLLVIKAAGKTLRELASDTSTWVQGGDFNPGSGGVSRAQQILLDTIDEATSRARADPEFAPFAALADDAAWQGILLLNCPVPPGQLPAQLSGLAAGIDASRFKAHHLGLTVTPAAATTAIEQRDSSLFGLVFYESRTTAAGAQGPYAFNVRTLKVRFESSVVATFSSQIELLVDQLFGEPATLLDPSFRAAPANVLLLDGVYQRQGADSGYAFSTTQRNVFSIASGVLDTVEVASAQFVTVTSPTPPNDPAARGRSRFVLNGALRFEQGPFDLFSFGPPTGASDGARLSPQRLFCSDLGIVLDYVAGDRSRDAYRFDATALALDAAQSPPRPASFFAGFPLTLSGFLHVPPAPRPADGSRDRPPAPATPASLGFLGVQAPLPSGALRAPWFGIVADLGLGTAGALAAEAGFKASLLAAWSPGTPTSPNCAVALKLPGTGGDARLLSLEGVLKLKVGDLQLAQDGTTYVLALQRIALSVLMLSFPSGGQIDALLFADPTGRDHTTLGWYAGYAKTGGDRR